MGNNHSFQWYLIHAAMLSIKLLVKFVAGLWWVGSSAAVRSYRVTPLCWWVGSSDTVKRLKYSKIIFRWLQHESLGLHFLCRTSFQMIYFPVMPPCPPLEPHSPVQHVWHTQIPTLFYGTGEGKGNELCFGSALQHMMRYCWKRSWVLTPFCELTSGH